MKRSLLAACGLALAVSATALARPVSFDSMSGVANTFWSIPSGGGSLASTGNRQIGEALTLSAPAGSSISGFDTALVNNTGASLTLTSLELHYWFWGTASLATTGTTPAFSSVLQSGTVAFTLGPSGFTLATNNLAWITGDGTQAGGVIAGITLGTAIPVSANQTIGYVQQWWGTTAAQPTLGPIGGLTGLITAGAAAPAPSIGANAFGSGAAAGYYRSASAETNGNFLGSSFRTINGGINTNIMMRVFTVPAPTAAAVLGLGGLIAGRRRRA